MRAVRHNGPHFSYLDPRGEFHYFDCLPACAEFAGGWLSVRQDEAIISRSMVNLESVDGRPEAGFQLHHADGRVYQRFPALQAAGIAENNWVDLTLPPGSPVTHLNFAAFLRQKIDVFKDVQARAEPVPPAHVHQDSENVVIAFPGPVRS